MQFVARYRNAERAAPFRPIDRKVKFFRLIAGVALLLWALTTLAQGAFAAPPVAAPAAAQGGPYESISADANNGDQQFRSLFNAYRRLDQGVQAAMAVPSLRPVHSFNFTSGYGVRSDPFRGSAAMHAGIDLAGPIGTPIYAAADGIVGRAQWANGYGNLVEIEHGRGIQTRYGHLSAILVHPGQPVRRGDLIARMGSTGRSTGSHLHYEVRLDGRAVNPIPFLQSSDYLMAMQQRAQGSRIALGGPEN